MPVCKPVDPSASELLSCLPIYGALTLSFILRETAYLASLSNAYFPSDTYNVSSMLLSLVHSDVQYLSSSL